MAWLDEYLEKTYGKDTDIDIRNLPIDPRYQSLYRILMEAFEHAAEGKGDDRHGSAECFENQISAQINHRRRGYALGQAEKKLDETRQLIDPEKKAHELLGAINYIAIEILELRTECQDGRTKVL